MVKMRKNASLCSFLAIYLTLPIKYFNIVICEEFFVLKVLYTANSVGDYLMFVRGLKCYFFLFSLGLNGSQF